MNDATVSSLRRRIGLTAAYILLLHVLLSITFTLTPKSAVRSSVVGLMYSRLMLIGPFFDEARIKTSPHLFVRYFENNRWTTARDRAKENHLFFLTHPWRYDRIRINYFERYLSHRVELLGSTSLDAVKEVRAFRELNQFVLQEYIKQPVDSVSLVYGVNRYFPETNTTEFDTTFAYTFNPAEIGLVKQSY